MRGMRVLVCDDNATRAAFYSRCLPSGRMNATGVASGMEALDVMERAHAGKRSIQVGRPRRIHAGDGRLRARRSDSPTSGVWSVRVVMFDPHWSARHARSAKCACAG